jgi:ribosome-associated protein
MDDQQVLNRERATDFERARMDNGERALLRRTGERPSARLVAQWAAAAGLDRKATRVDIIDVTGRTDYADYLVLMSGSSDRNVVAIAQGVEQDLGRRGVHALPLEGLSSAVWVLIDLLDVVVHVFHEDWRDTYNLDGLWMDAPRLGLVQPGR